MELFINEIWKNFLYDGDDASELSHLVNKIEEERKKTIIYPSIQNLFSAFNLCPLEKLSVVIIGQDPYHGPGQANGLAFSVNDGIKVPASLRNILKEVQSNCGKAAIKGGNLEFWAKQGVLLLNSILSVRSGQPGSHSNIGWQKFSDRVISRISAEQSHIVFMLWGIYAKSKVSLISNNHLVLHAPHPSPFSAHTGFFGCEHFKLANEFLTKIKKNPINW